MTDHFMGSIKENRFFFSQCYFDMISDLFLQEKFIDKHIL